MASLISTMFVSSPSLPSFPQMAKPLSPVQTLEQSSSCIHLDPSGEIAEARLSTPAKGSGLGEAMARLLSLTPPDQRWPRARADPRAGQPHDVDIEKEDSAHKCSSPLRKSMSSCAAPGDQNIFSGQELRSSDQRVELTNSCSPFRNARARPFRQQKSTKGSSSWQLKQFAEATLGSGSLRKAVRLPEGEDVNEWLAVNSESRHLVTYLIDTTRARTNSSRSHCIKLSTSTTKSTFSMEQSPNFVNQASAPR